MLVIPPNSQKENHEDVTSLSSVVASALIALHYIVIILPPMFFWDYWSHEPSCCPLLHSSTICHVTNRPCCLSCSSDIGIVAIRPSDCSALGGDTHCGCTAPLHGGKSWCLQSFFNPPPNLLGLFMCVFLFFGVWDKAKRMLCSWISDCECKLLRQMKQKTELSSICIIKSVSFSINYTWGEN